MKNISNITIIVIFSLLIFCFLTLRRLANQNKVLSDKVSFLTELNNIKNKNLNLEVVNTAITLDSIKLLSHESDTIILKDVLVNKNKGLTIIFRCDKSTCESCMVEVSECLKEFMNIHKIRDNIIILGNYKSTNDIRINSNYWGINNIYGVVEDLGSDNVKINKIHFLIIDQEHNIRNIFIPNAYDLDEIKTYLEAVNMIMCK